MIKAVIFDCDGVLVDSEILAISGEREALTKYGLNYSRVEYVQRFVGLHDDAFFEELRSDYRAAFSRAAPSDFEDKVLEGRRKERHALTKIDGAEDALLTARRLVGAVGVASSSRSEFLSSKLERTGLLTYAAPHIYSADLVANGKPSPDIFLYTAKQMKVAPEDCLVVEDSENGVRAGRAAGMTVCGFLGGGHCYQGHGDRLSAAGAHYLSSNFKEFITQGLR